MTTDRSAVRRSAQAARLPGLLAVSCLVTALTSMSGIALAASIGGTDAQSQYTGFNPVVSDSGIFTFDDTLNGLNPSAEPGTVTTADGPGLAGMIGGVIDLELMLDTSGYDPATGAPLDATFIGTGPGAEIFIWEDVTRTTMLLALDVSFVNVSQALPLEFAPPRGALTLGNVQLNTLGIESQLEVLTGSFANAVGGVGTLATLQILIDDPLPNGFALADLLGGGFWNESLTVGFNTNPTSSITWEINFDVPEPGTTTFLISSLLGLACARRRIGRRE